MRETRYLSVSPIFCDITLLAFKLTRLQSVQSSHPGGRFYPYDAFPTPEQTANAKSTSNPSGYGAREPHEIPNILHTGDERTASV